VLEHDGALGGAPGAHSGAHREGSYAQDAGQCGLAYLDAA
jgi:hypothetical protein